MKKVSRCLGILILAGSMAAPAYAAQQPNHGHAGSMPHQQAMHDHHGTPGFHRCTALGQVGRSAAGYSSPTFLSAKIGQGYLGPGRTDPLPPGVNGSDAAPQVCCILDSTSERPASS